MNACGEPVPGSPTGWVRGSGRAGGPEGIKLGRPKSHSGPTEATIQVGPCTVDTVPVTLEEVPSRLRLHIGSSSKGSLPLPHDVLTLAEPLSGSG